MLFLNKNKLSYSVSIVIWMLIFSPRFVFGATLSNWTNSDTLVEYVTLILDAVLKMGGLVVVMLLVYAGFLFVIAQGNDQKLEEAKKSLTWVIVGAAIILGGWAVTEVIINTVDTVLP